jgi:hypothetical protein
LESAKIQSVAGYHNEKDGGKMRKSLKFLLVLVLSVFLFAIPMSASATNIDDNYWGGTAERVFNQDVIGTVKVFGVNSMNVSFQADGLHVDINTAYVDNFLSNIGLYGSSVGDLFIGTSGWAPTGFAPYKVDNYITTGTNWNYALAFDSYPTAGEGTTSGSASLYGINEESDFVLSNHFFGSTGYGYRANQMVRVNKQKDPVAGGGSWALDEANDLLKFIVPYEFGAVDGGEIALHWGMTCANDIIEGGAPVPEPATMLLLGFGLIGLAGIGRKKFKKS